MSKENFESQIKQSCKEIAEHLSKGNDIIIKSTKNGLKIQSMEVKTINNK